MAFKRSGVRLPLAPPFPYFRVFRIISYLVQVSGIFPHIGLARLQIVPYVSAFPVGIDVGIDHGSPDRQAGAKPLDSGQHGDGGSLYLRISPTGAKSWIQRITSDRHRRDIGLGGYTALPLARARLLANAIRAAVAAGLDPLAAKRSAKVPTFRGAAEAVFALDRVR